MPSFGDGTVTVIVDIDVRSLTIEDFSGTDQTDLGGGLIVVNVETAGYLENLQAMQQRCPEGVDNVNVAY